MRHTPDEALQLVIHNDDQTPWAFVVDLICSVFSRSEAEAEALTATVSQQGKAVCGSYPSAVAKAMLETAEQRIKAAGHPLRITAAPGETDAVAATGRPTRVSLRLTATSDGAAAAIGHPTQESRDRKFKYAHEAIAWHFSGLAHDEIIATSRQFPGHMRADVQVALDKLFSASPIRFFGLYEQHRYETLTYAALTKDGQYAVTISAAQFQEVDIGESEPVKCLNNGLWLNRDGDLHYAVVLSFHREYGREAGTCVEIAVPAGEAGVALVDRCFAQLEAAINAARSYRGKVLSLETEGDYQGRSKGVMVHRLPQVQRDAVILPEQTLRLLDRNVIRFIESREALRRLGQSTRKGILLYGPPGTGKTHTVRYLAANLPGHTTLIITADRWVFCRNT